MKPKLVISAIVLFVALIIVIANFPIVNIPAGQRGVVYSNISGIENKILGEGTHFRTPFVESVYTMPIQTQATTFQEQAGSSDSQIITVNLTVNWHLDPAYVNRIYQQVGTIDTVVSNILTPNTQDSIKAATSKFVALDIQKNRDVVSANAQALLQGKLKKYHVVVDTLSITNINFSTEFNAAVEQAQVAQQNAKKAEYDVTTATNEAAAAVAKAEGQAKAQAAIQQTLTPAILYQQWIARWDGKLPTYMLGSNASQLLNLPTPPTQ